MIGISGRSFDTSLCRLALLDFVGKPSCDVSLRCTRRSEDGLGFAEFRRSRSTNEGRLLDALGGRPDPRRSSNEGVDDDDDDDA